MTTPTQAQIEAAKALIKRFEYESMALHHIQRDWLVREIAALTAAAGVESTFLSPRELIAATIERCAHVAEQWERESYPGDFKTLIARIRALKQTEGK